jgi:hypothetical protein
VEINGLVEKSKVAPGTLTDSELAAVFVHLFEFPLDGFSSTDLLRSLLKREGSASYEIARALALYYSNLHGDFFYVSDAEDFLGNGGDYDEAYARAVEYANRALQLRNDSYDERLERYGEFDDSYVERDFAFCLAGLLAEIHAIGDALNDALGKGHECAEQIKALQELAEGIAASEAPLAVLKATRPEWSAYTALVRRAVDALHQND